MARVLLVDDDAPFLEGLALAFEDAGHEITQAIDGAEALVQLAGRAFDCVIADVNMPRLDGFTLCRKLREAGNAVPLILLTTRDGEIDEALGLELGADDYVSKPFRPRVLFARVDALLRRACAGSRATEILARGDLSLEPERLRATYAGTELSLTVTEYRLLEALSAKPGFVLSRERLLEVIRDDDANVALRIIDTYVGRLRKKLRAIVPTSEVLETVIGAGYRWRDDP